MYQVNALSCNAVTSYTFFILSSIICCVVHSKFVTNHNCLGSLLPTHLKISIFIAFTVLNGWCGGIGGGGGEGVGVGVCCRGGGGGVVDGWGILEIPWLTIYNALHSVLKIFPSSSLEEDPNNELYSEPNSSFFFNSFPLRVVPNIKVMA